MNYKVLVDSKHVLGKAYFSNLDLISVSNIFGDIISVEKRVYKKYVELYDDLLADNIKIGIVRCFDLSLSNEFCTGLAMEIVLNYNNNYLYTDCGRYDDYLENFDTIKSRLHKYGFIVRNFSDGGWYIRYVGFSTANIIYNNNITLEEYDSKYNVSGILVVNKPSGMTSRDVVNCVGRLFDTKKVGHTGTLDPLASGVLILTIGQATKISSLIVANDKDYLATVKVGLFTDTLDIEGNILKEECCSIPSNIKDMLVSFNGTYMQEVPIYSAVKVNGKKLYQYARNNESVTLPKRSVTIGNMNFIDSTNDTFRFSCSVSKGTYIRGLIRDIGEKANTCMVMSDLVRTRQGKFTLDDSYTLDDIENGYYKIIPIDKALDLPVIEINDEVLFKIKNGAKILNIYNVRDKILFKNSNKIIAIYVKDGDFLKSFINFS